MANEITLGITLNWTKSGQVVKGTVSETFSQSGNNVIGHEQQIGGTTEAIELGEVSGAKHLMFKSLQPKETAEAPQPVIYIDTVTPVVTSAPSAIKLVGAAGTYMNTINDTWYAIATGDAITAGGTAGLFVCSVEE